MKLLTKALLKKLPKLYSQEKVKALEAIAYAHFFTPDAAWDWWATEFDGEDTFFGFVIGLDAEMGYFSLSELQAAKRSLGLKIERDRHFKPTMLKNIKRIVDLNIYQD